MVHVLRENVVGFLLIREVRASTPELVCKDAERWQKPSRQGEQLVRRPCAAGSMLTQGIKGLCV